MNERDRAAEHAAIQQAASQVADPDAPETDPEAPDGETGRPPTGPAGGEITALVLAVAAVVLGLTIVWCFLAVPVAIAAFVVALVQWRRARRAGRPANGLVVSSLVLAPLGFLLAGGALILVPRALDVGREAVDVVQGDVRHDLDAANKDLNDRIDQIDDSSAQDFQGLEDTMTNNLDQAESRLQALVLSIEQQLGADVDEAERAADDAEASVRDDLDAAGEEAQADVDTLRTEIERIEADVRADIDAIIRALRAAGIAIEDGG